MFISGCLHVVCLLPDVLYRALIHSAHVRCVPAQARRVVLMAFGENKAGIAARAVEGPVTEQVPASFLQHHPNATAFLDVASSSGLFALHPHLHADVPSTAHILRALLFYQCG